MSQSTTGTTLSGYIGDIHLRVCSWTAAENWRRRSDEMGDFTLNEPGMASRRSSLVIDTVDAALRDAGEVPAGK